MGIGVSHRRRLGVVGDADRNIHPQVAADFGAKHLADAHAHIQRKAHAVAHRHAAAGAGDLLRVGDGLDHGGVVGLIHGDLGLIVHRGVQTAAGVHLKAPVPGHRDGADHQHRAVGVAEPPGDGHINAAAGLFHAGVFVVAAQKAEHDPHQQGLVRVTPGALLFGAVHHAGVVGNALFQLVQLVVHHVLEGLHAVTGLVLLAGGQGALGPLGKVFRRNAQRRARKHGAVGQHHHRHRQGGNLNAQLKALQTGNGGGQLAGLFQGGQLEFVLGIAGLRADGPLHRQAQRRVDAAV